MSPVFKRGRVWYLDTRHKGRRIRKRVGTSKHVAEMALKELEAKIARQEFGIEQEDITVDRLIALFLDYNRTNHRSSTTARYRSITDHFRRYLDEGRPDIVTVSQLKPEVLEGYKAFRRDEWVNPNGRPVGDKRQVKSYTRKGARARTVNLELDGLKTMFNLAIRWEYMKDNPVKQVKPLKTDDRKPVRFLTVEECERLLEASDRDMRRIIFVFLNTGMRKSELEHLQWGDVDLDRRRILIRGKADWRPKTNEREIPISEDVREVILEIRRESQKPTSEAYVFPVKSVGRHHNWLRYRLLQIARDAGIPDLTRIHTLRHTFASHLVMQGVDLPTVGKLMGHSDIETTMIYAHLAPEHLANALTKLPFRRG